MMKKIWEKIWNIMKQRWFWTLMLVLLVAILFLIWGSAISINQEPVFESFSSRLSVGFGLIGIWALCILIGYGIKKQKEKSEENKEELARKREKESTVSSIYDELVNRLNKALSVIKQAGLHGRLNEKTKYQLPWYMVVGQSESGKTSLLEGSGFDFPLNPSSGKYVRDIEKTKYCEWYFANHAILLDSSGRFFEIDTGKAKDEESVLDRKAWNKFLTRLRSVRRRRPLNGIILTLPITEFLVDGKNNTIEAKAQNTRIRLTELKASLNVEVPVYLIFTQMDQLDGFKEFFAHLTQEEKDQVMGVTFNGDDGQSSEKIDLEFEELMRRISGQVMPLLHTERDFGRRAKILSFPEKMATISENLKVYCELAFSPTHYHTTTNLRGFYFTAVPQEQKSDKGSQRIAGGLGISGQAVSSRSGQKGFFIRRLLEEVIFPESELATLDRSYERKIRLRNYSIVGGSIAVVVICTLGWVHSFLMNNDRQKELSYMQDVYKNELIKLPPVPMSIQVLPALNTLKHSKDLYPTREKWFEPYLGLSQSDEINEETAEVYRQRIETMLLPEIMTELQEQMIHNFDNRDFLLNSLKAYLMLNQQDHLDKDFLLDWMSLIWSYRYRGQAAEQEQLKNHFAYLLEHGFKSPTLNQNLVNKARKELRQAKVSKLVYDMMLQSELVHSLPSIRFADFLGNSKDLFENANINIPGFYTKKGYQTVFLAQGLQLVKDLIKENWILGESSDLSIIEIRNIYAEVEDYYFIDYISHWKSAVAKLRLVPAYTTETQIEQLTSLTGAGQPIVRILSTIQANTSLVEKKEKKEAAPGGDNTYLNQVASTAVLADARTESAREAVSRQFEELNSLLPDGEVPNILLQDAMVTLDDLNTKLSSNLYSPTPTHTAYLEAVDRMQGKESPINSVMNAGKTLPAPLNLWWETAASSAWQGQLMLASRYIEEVYRRDVLANYDLALKGRYPFVNRSETDTNIADFTAFFGPSGHLKTFYYQTVEPFIVRYHGQLKEKRIDGYGIGLSDKWLRSMNHGLTISRVFFGQNKDSLQFSFSLQPNSLSSNVASSELTYGNSKVVYRHGPVLKTDLNWPFGPNQKEAVELSLKDFDDNEVLNYSATGNWALFKLLDKVDRLKTYQPEMVAFGVNEQGLGASYLLHSKQLPNPLTPKLLQFSLPEQLNR